MASWFRSGDFEATVLPNGIRLHAVRAPRYKTTLVTAFARSDLGDRAAWTALLPFVLKRGCRAFPTEASLRRHLERLCGTTLEAGVHRFGSHQIVSWELEIPCERFLPIVLRRDFLGEAFEVLRDLWADPLVQGGAFRSDYVAREKANLAAQIRSLVEQKDRYAYERCRALMAGKTALAIHPYGTLVDLEMVRPGSLWSHYRTWLERAPVDLYAMGPEAPQEILKRAMPALTFPRRAASSAPARPTFVKFSGVRRRAERARVAQGRICLGFATNIDPWDDGRASDAFLVYNGILGGYPHSRLFQQTREKESLAYSISSVADRATGWLFAEAGVAPGNRQKALVSILRQVDSLARGRIERKEFALTVAAMRQGLRRLVDLRAAQIDAHYEEGLLGRTFTRSAALARLTEVTLEDVRRVAGSVRLAASFFLGPA